MGFERNLKNISPLKFGRVNLSSNFSIVNYRIDFKKDKEQNRVKSFKF